MSFNFGDKPFKYALPQGYQAINTAPKNVIVSNSSSGDASSSSSKPANNAPQAIIIEVFIHFYLYW